MRPLSKVLLVLAVAGCTAAGSIPTAVTDAPRNVIFVVSDGAGPAYFTLARDFARANGDEDGLVFDSMLSGMVRTYSTNSKVTDSSSGATAFASGVKTDNKMLGVRPDGGPVGTILEAAEADGWVTGLVTTTRVTHATPASFAAHHVNRDQENDIASQMLTQDIELIVGGGKRHFLPASEGGLRPDRRNLLDEASGEGVSVIRDDSEFFQSSSLPVLYLLSASHLEYEIDRHASNQPSLADLTRRSLELLEATGERFFIVVEAGRVDHAGHGNDPAGVLRDMQAYEEAMREIKKFARQNGETLVVATSDHETGGMALGHPTTGPEVYMYYPERLGPISKSGEKLTAELLTRLRAGSSAAELSSWIENQLSTHFATDTLGVERQKKMAALVRGAVSARTYLTARLITNEVMDIVSERAWIGWYSPGHSAVDVPLFSFGPGSDQFRGHLDNTDVGLRMARLMGVDLEAATDRLETR